MKKAAIFGIIILISISTLFRGLYFSLDSYGFLAALALLLTIYFLAKIVRNEPIRINKLFISFGIVLIAAAMLSFAKALNQRQNLEHLFLYTELLILFVVLYDYFHDKKQKLIQYMMAPAVIVGFVAAVVGLMSLTQRFNIWQVYAENNRVGSTFQYANTASVYFLLCGIFVITIINATKNALVTTLMMGAGSTIMFAFFMTGSRGGYLVAVFLLLLLLIQPKGYRVSGAISLICMIAPGFMVMRSFNASTAAHDNFGAAKWIAVSFAISAIAWLLFYLLKKLITRGKQVLMPKGSGLIFAASAVVALILLVVFWDRVIALMPAFIVNRVDSLFKSGFQEKNVLYRLIFDRDALKLIADNWLFGLGAGGWKAKYQSVQDLFYTAKTVHNQYLQVFVENGILGFLSFSAMVILSALGAFFSWLRAGDGRLKVYTAGLLCGFLALASHAAFDFDLTYISLMFLFWLMFAASTVSLSGEEPLQGGEGLQGEEGLKGGEGKLLLIDSFICQVPGNAVKMIFIVCSAALFSFNALYFAGAYNSQIAFDYMQEGNIKQARIYYEEANRLDPTNTSYTFELANIYHSYSKNTVNDEYKRTWLEKARIACEKSVDGDRDYPAYMNMMVRIYLDSDMPLEALELSQRLVLNQKYNAECYRLLAASYVGAADYYEKNGDVDKAGKLLEECLQIDKNPHLRMSHIKEPKDLDSEEIIASYEHSEGLAKQLREAESMLEGLE